MKAYIKAKSYLDESGYQGQLSDATQMLIDVQRICSNLEDFYFGSPVVDEFTKCYKFSEKALAALDRARAQLY